MLHCMSPTKCGITLNTYNLSVWNQSYFSVQEPHSLLLSQPEPLTPRTCRFHPNHHADCSLGDNQSQYQ